MSRRLVVVLAAALTALAFVAAPAAAAGSGLSSKSLDHTPLLVSGIQYLDYDGTILTAQVTRDELRLWSGDVSVECHVRLYVYFGVQHLYGTGTYRAPGYSTGVYCDLQLFDQSSSFLTIQNAGNTSIYFYHDWAFFFPMKRSD